MPREGRTTETVMHGVSGFTATHRRLVLLVALTVLFIAMQGAASAELFGATINGHSSVTGP